MKINKMKKLITFLFILAIANTYGQSIADSTINSMARFNCECQDSIDISQNKETINRQFQECFTQSMITYLNKRELTSDYLTDQKKLRWLQNKVFIRLYKCDKTMQIINRLDDTPKPLDSVPIELFIDDVFIEKNGLKKGQIEKDFIVWNSTTNKHIQRVVDIRWVFKTTEDALKYHQAKLKENSEDGQEITIDTIIQALDLHVYKESKAMENMLSMMKLQQKQYYFLFVVDNVAFKIFVATDQTLEAKDVVFIVEEAINKMSKYKANR
jgi:hypothetical protein